MTDFGINSNLCFVNVKYFAKIVVQNCMGRQLLMARLYANMEIVQTGE